MAALETRQGRHEPPQAYYSRLRQAYFVTRNEPDLKDELNFKTLFPEEPSSRHKPPYWRSRMSTNNEYYTLRDLEQKAYGKQKMTSEKNANTPAVLDFNTRSQGLALEGAQCQLLLGKVIARKFYLSIIIERHLRVEALQQYGSQHYPNVYRTPRESSRKNEKN